MFSQSQWSDGWSGHSSWFSAKIGIGEWGYLQENQSIPINHTDGIIALDGERELPVRSGKNGRSYWIEMVR